MRAHPRPSFSGSLHLLLATVAGLALRMFLVLRFPADSGDSDMYRELARNWLDSHVYGLYYANGLVPSDVRSPGYPAFLSLLYLTIGRSQLDIVLAQGVLDLCSCFLIAWLAAQLAPASQRSRIFRVGLWLSATCPFVANYAAVPLAEVLATFLTAAALIPLTQGCIAAGLGMGSSFRDGGKGSPTAVRWFLGGFLAGLGTLVRPETPLLLVALAVTIGFHWRRRTDWGKLVRAGVSTGLGLLLALAPWAARNAVRFHEVQLLAPRYAATPDEYTPRGLYSWTGTWLTRFRDVYLVPWNIGSVPVSIEDVSGAAFDSPDERVRVAALLDQYNVTLRMTPTIDGGFAELARERTTRHPLRTYLFVPLGRVWTLWFTPRVDLLPFSGHLWPIGQQWRKDKVDVSVTLLFGALNFFYVGLALFGLSRALGQTGPEQRGVRLGIGFLVLFVIVRTAFLTTVETPEPRYVLECFPVVLAFGAQAWRKSEQ